MPAPELRPQVERERRFSSEDVQRFAAASGDRNPLHLESEFSRRTAFGDRLVHGALVAIGLLGLLPAEELGQMRSVRLWFGGAVLPDRSYAGWAGASAKRAGAWEARLTGRGKVLARAVAQPDLRAFAGSLIDPPADRRPSDRPPADQDRAMGTAAPETPVAELEPGHRVAGRYCAGPELLDLAAALGAECLDPALLEGLAWASYVVGMEIPGRHALFAGLTLAAAGQGGAGPGRRHAVTLRSYDQRAGRVLLDGVLSDGGGTPLCLAAIEAFDLPPVPPLDPRALGSPASPAALPSAGGVVVIGGSRGFGAALTLALLGHGFEVHGVYSGEASSAHALAGLAGSRQDQLHLHRLDARDPAAVQGLADELAAADLPIVGLVLNAAPAPLAMGVTGGSGGELADYVADSLRLAAVPLGALLPLITSASGWILFCSSAAVTAPPRDWPHYVTAKAALEGLAGWLAATAPQLRTIVLRPPAMRTGMTNTPSGRIAAVAPEPVAAWIAERIAGGGLPTGLSVQHPPGPERGGR